MRREELRILDRITFDSRQRFCAVRHARRVAEIDEAFVGQMFVQRAIDGQSAYAAIEDADGELVHVRTACGSGRAVLVKLRQLLSLSVKYIINRTIEATFIP